MRTLYGQSQGGLILLHGGAGSWDVRGENRLGRATASLRRIVAEGWEALRKGAAPLDVALVCLRGMEDDELFNAGRGASIQADGVARLTASMMDGDKQSFSGVMGVRYLNHPSELARKLQERRARVLIEPGTELLARELGLPIESAVVKDRLMRWQEKFDKGGFSDEDGCDTVGCVVLTQDGRLAVGTSTGGRGFEFPGRVSDSATVAGTYCTKFAAISATGTGEEIVDDALCARLETRRRDGMSLEQASQRCFDEAVALKRGYGWIAADQTGHWAAVHTTPQMSYVVMGAKGELAASAP